VEKAVFPSTHINSNSNFNGLSSIY